MDLEAGRLITHFGKALWADASQAQNAVLETTAAVSLLDLPTDLAVDRTTSVLLAQAEKTPPSANAQALNNPFYRLTPRARLILSALQYAHWSYARLAKTLQTTENEIIQTAWDARCRLSAGRVRDPYPSGSRFEGINCPEYDPKAPWTQTLMDDEIPSRGRLFLQTHLLSCDRCQAALNQCREIYYAADEMIPNPKNTDEIERMANAITLGWRKTQAYAHGKPMTFADSLLVFLRRTEARIALAAGVFAVVLFILRT